MSSSRKHNLKVMFNLGVHLSCILLICAFICLFVSANKKKAMHRYYNSYYNSSLMLQSLMLSIAKGLLEAEAKEKEEEKKRYMVETCPDLSLPSGIQALQVMK